MKEARGPSGPLLSDKSPTLTDGKPGLTLEAMAKVLVVKDDNLTRFLQKPVDFDLLAKTIAAFLGAAAPPAAPAPPPPAAKPFDPDAGSSGGEILDLD